MIEAILVATDAKLLEDAAAGDADAYAVFFRRHVGSVTIYAVRRCGNPEDVADLVADTFLIALQAAGRYLPETETALPWLFGIARRVLARQRRRSAGAVRLFLKASNAHVLFTSSEDDEVASAIDASRQASALEAALAQLSNGERDVLELVAYDGLSPSEVAMVLNLSPNAARLRLSRARRHLRQILDGGLAIDAEARHAI
ncbi:MAG: sigma-70 family RNA polymerase sigma factor [Acidimicrobiia bacterium]|nr:sigma-70 family RNA polymerase sigma factor [Acidimicrobiia bacterium]